MQAKAVGIDWLVFHCKSTPFPLAIAHAYHMYTSQGCAYASLTTKAPCGLLLCGVVL
jgi:hypothetical protein